MAKAKLCEQRGKQRYHVKQKAAVQQVESIKKSRTKGGIAVAARAVSFVQSNRFSNKVDQGEKAPSNPN